LLVCRATRCLQAGGQKQVLPSANRVTAVNQQSKLRMRILQPAHWTTFYAMVQSSGYIDSTAKRDSHHPCCCQPDQPLLRRQLSRCPAWCGASGDAWRCTGSCCLSGNGSSGGWGGSVLVLIVGVGEGGSGVGESGTGAAPRDCAADAKIHTPLAAACCCSQAARLALWR